MFEDKTLELPNLFGLFKKKKKKCIGIDIGSSNIKVVELEKKGNKIVLKNYAITKTNKKDLIKPGSSKIISADVGRVVERVLDDIGIKTKEFNVAVPSFASLITTIELPPVSEKEIDQIIQVEAPKYIPIPLDEVVYGWEVIENEIEKEKNLKLSKSTRDSMTKVVLVSIMKSISQEYEKVFRENGFVVGSLEVDMFALKRSIVNEKNTSCAIVDIGSNITNISIVVNKSIVVNRSIDVGGERFTELISQAMGISEERADKIKKEQGLNVDSQDIKKQILSPLLMNIADEINKSIEVFSENYDGFIIDSLILTGGFSQMSGLSEFIANETKMKITNGNPWKKISYPEKLKDSLNSLSPYFGTAVGLALRDLLDGEK